MAKTWRECFCPVCGRTAGMRNIYTDPRKTWSKTGEVNFWSQEQYSRTVEDTHLGVIKTSEGKGSIRMERYYEPDEDAEGFAPLVKERLLRAMEIWVQKGWMTAGEVQARMQAGAAAPAASAAAAPPPPAKAPRKTKPAPPPPVQTAQSIIADLQGMLDEENKGKSIAKVERALEKLDQDVVEGIEDVDTAIEEYRDIAREGLTPEEYADEKQSAFESIQEALDALEVTEE